MGFKINEKDLINNNIFKYEEKLNTQYSRFLDKTPVYVTYYNINTIETTVDLGFSNVEKILGSNSPIRFNEVKNFPIYGMEAIQLNIDDGDEGLNTSYDGELIILPGTIVPYQNDFFMIDHKGQDFLFMVTGVEYDTIKSHNFYKISFSVKYVDPEESKKILRQVTKQYTCIVDNIGTEEKCIIENDELDLIMRLQEVYNNLTEKYIMYFYNKKFNTFVYNDINGNIVYDRYLNMFIQKHGLIYDKDTHKCIYLSNEDDSCSFNMEYDMSLYKAYELRKPKRFSTNKFKLESISNIYSVFNYYGNKNCSSVRFINGRDNYLNSVLVKAVQTGNSVLDGNVEMDDSIPIFYLKDNVQQVEKGSFDELDLFIIKYMNDQIDSIRNINMDDLEDDIFFDLNWSSFIKIPFALYAIKGYYKLFMQKQVIK